jgi:rhodanese-related sulfurtransferase
MKNLLAPLLLITVIGLPSCDQAANAESDPNPSKASTTSKPTKEAPPAPAAEASRDIDVAAAAKLLAENKEIVVLDIRTPNEFANGHIKGAVNIDFMGGDFAAKIGALDKDKTYLMHCQSGGRSGKSLAKFKELGFKSVLHLDSGYGGWVKAEQPTEK